MHRVPLIAAILAIVAIAGLCLSRAGTALAVRSVTYGGEPVDNFWDIDITTCTDGFRITATQTQLSTQQLAFSVQLTQASPAVTAPLPFRIAGGDGSTIAAGVHVQGTAFFLFTTAQSPGTTLSIRIERWDHGHSNTDEGPGESDTDESTNDDVIDTTDTVGDCMIRPAAPPTDTGTASATATATTLPTDTATATAIPSATPTATAPPSATATATAMATVTATQPAAPTATTVPSATVAATSTSTATAVPVTGAPVSAASAAVGPRTSQLVAVMASADLSRGGGRGQLTETCALFVPTGALREQAVLHLAVLPAETSLSAPQRGSIGLDLACALSATSAATGRALAGSDHTRPMLVQIGYGAADLGAIDPATLRIAYLDASSHAWHDLPTTVDAVHRVLTAAITQFAVVQLRATAHGNAQVQAAQNRLAALIAAGAPRMTVLRTAQPMVGGMPLVIAFPSGSQQAPISLQVTGAPHAQLRASFTLLGVTIVQSLSLDANGYATTAFMPDRALQRAHPLQMTLAVTLGASRYTTTATITLLPGQIEGPVPYGAPPLWARLASPSVRAQTLPPLLIVHTAPDATVSAALAWTGRALPGFATLTGAADRQGIVRLRLQPIPRTLVVALAGGKKALVLQVVVTASRHGQSSQQMLTLSVAP